MTPQPPSSAPPGPARRLALFDYGFRPFFLLAGWFAIIVIGWWLWSYSRGQVPFLRLPLHFWHGHEMIFGFISAAIAGFLLTAVPSWTGSRGFGGAPLVILTLAWLLGRVAFWLANVIPFPLLVLAELAFFPALAAVLAPALLRERNRNTPMLLVLAVLWACDAAFLYALHRTDPVMASAALRAALGVVLVLITVIGGRIVPAFTGNALRQRGLEVQLRSYPVLERLVVGLMIVLVLVDIFIPTHWLTAGVAAAAGLAQAVRLAGWQGRHTLRLPIVWVLHAAYAWLPLGLILRAAFLFGGFPWAAFWMHALGAGAAATMIVAVMSRAALGHTGRPLRLSPGMTWAYGLLIAAALVRVFGPTGLPLDYRATLLLAGGLWIAGFLVFAVIYTPILLKPRVDGKPG